MNPRTVRESVPRNGQPAGNGGHEHVVMEDIHAPGPSRVQAPQMVPGPSRPGPSRPGSSRPGKRPVKNVSPQEKVRAIDRVHEGESKASVARDIGVPESTLRGWCKSEHKIRSQCGNLPPANHSSASSSTGSKSNHSVSASSEEDGPTTSKRRANHTARQNSQQDMAIPGPSTSSGSNGAYLGCVDNRNHNVVGRDQKAKMESYASLVASMNVDNLPNIALQQLGLLNPQLTTNLLNMTTLGQPATVGLVENGLQYSRGNTARTLPSLNIACGLSDSMPCALENNVQRAGAMGNAVDHGLVNRHMAIAPAQMTARPGTRKSPSVSPAAEAPSTPVAASPNENNAQPSTSRSRHSTGNINRFDEGMWTWVLQQHRMSNERQPTVPIDPSDGRGWFWHWWKNYSFPLMLGQSATPEQVRAMLDAVLGANNTASNINGESHGQNNADERYRRSNENEIHGQSGVETRSHNVAYENENVPMEPMGTTMDNNPGSAGIDEAIEHGDMLLEWLENCSNPRISRLQIMQFRCLLDSLKKVRDLPSRQSRRNRMESAQQNHHV